MNIDPMLYIELMAVYRKIVFNAYLKVALSLFTDSSPANRLQTIMQLDDATIIRMAHELLGEKHQ